MTIAQARTVLGLPENFSLDQLKSQYRKKVLIAHPDRNGGNEKKFLLVQQAFEILTNFKENGTVYHQANQKSDITILEECMSSDDKRSKPIKKKCIITTNVNAVCKKTNPSLMNSRPMSSASSLLSLCSLLFSFYS
jgi:hypothetical protein